MIFPFVIEKEEMPMRIKEWELLGYDVEEAEDALDLGPRVSIYKPRPSFSQFPDIPVHRSWTNYSWVTDAWARNGPDPEERG